MKIEDLKPAPYNPRKIGDDAVDGLSKSIELFGDIAGIVWNKRTGHLVSGHQRLSILKKKYGDGLKMRGNSIVTPDGNTFAVRVVDWTNEQERAANISANNQQIAGVYDDDKLEALIAEIGDTDYAEHLDDLLITSILSGNEEKRGRAGELREVPDDDETIVDTFQVVVTCEDLKQQEHVFNKLTKEGYICKVLTLQCDAK